eukprot:CAMPEP_0114525072 /NCGR_PEP_ID=MMETSP0109-20121206/22211_1 /TAXON_ID=29199 /ORGANISM="Chlorarachnion reptans, Strain CCCM449" /LENGTH=197 /DNA_ID=CAMNT_0001706593 /DNA_START=177 /DNA_END=770 /DNA_ORIENTATION=-
MTKRIASLQSSNDSLKSSVKSLQTKLNKILKGRGLGAPKKRRHSNLGSRMKPRVPRPVGRAPRGKKWDYDSGGWVDLTEDDLNPPLGMNGDHSYMMPSMSSSSKPRKKQRTKMDKSKKISQASPFAPYYKRPRGANPKGKAWNYQTGEWVDNTVNSNTNTNKYELSSHGVGMSGSDDKDYAEAQRMILGGADKEGVM